MSFSVFHIVAHSGGWVIKQAGRNPSRRLSPSAQEAVYAAKALAMDFPPSQIRVHAPSGALLGEWTYDPHAVLTPSSRQPAAVAENLNILAHA